MEGRYTLFEVREETDESAGGPYGISAAQADIPAESLPDQREVVCREGGDMGSTE